MQPPLASSRCDLRAHRRAVEGAGAVLQLTGSVPARLRFLADQLCRAACSVPLNLAEGNGRCNRDRLHHWRIAYGSALEAGSALELLAAGGFVDARRARRVMAMLDEVRAMTFVLLHPRR